MNCSRCGERLYLAEESLLSAVVCARCVIGEMNWLDNHVLTPEHCAKMREDRGLSIHDLAKEAGCYPKVIKSFEANTRSCPVELVDSICTWYKERKSSRGGV